MGVYIKGIDIPKEDELIYLVIRNDGIVECVKSIAGSRDGEEPTTLIEIEKAKATYIPEPHGRLIDADVLKDELTKAIPQYIIDTKSRWFTEGLGRANIEIDDAPTIIEGSE